MVVSKIGKREREGKEKTGILRQTGSQEVQFSPKNGKGQISW